MRTTSSVLARVALLAALVGCGDSVNPVAPTPPTSELRAAPTAVVVSGTALRLETYLWRDFQPSSPPDGRPLIGVLQVKVADDGSMPDGVRIDVAWVVYGDRVWAAVPHQELGDLRDGSHEWVIRDGPKWGPGVTVDVVVRVRDAQGGAQLLRAADQLIRRTD